MHLICTPDTWPAQRSSSNTLVKENERLVCIILPEPLNHTIPSHPIPPEIYISQHNQTSHQTSSPSHPSRPVFRRITHEKPTTQLTEANSQVQNNKSTQTQQQKETSNVPRPTIPLRQRRRRRRRRRFLPLAELDHAFDIGVRGLLDRLSARRDTKVEVMCLDMEQILRSRCQFPKRSSNLVVTTRHRIAPLQLQSMMLVAYTPGTIHGPKFVQVTRLQCTQSGAILRLVSNKLPHS
jgi:hypothetical protein